LRKRSGEMKYNPHGDTALGAGDVLVVMGDVNQIWKARAAAGEAGSPSAA
jgi:K+/H+ antiporter YhaU regulatory subunit KhtT